MKMVEKIANFRVLTEGLDVAAMPENERRAYWRLSGDDEPTQHGNCPQCGCDHEPGPCWMMNYDRT
ncbi:MAG: hypothetical protein KGL39_12305 [Patescibacteria group bacterium]|nr:hypothetical protein [Patescibacteria group bacterium]